MIDSSDYSLKSDNNQAQQNNLWEKIKWLGFWRSLVYLMLVSLGGGISYSWYFFTEEMIPSIENSVSKFLSRPIKLGEIEAVSFNSIRLGETNLPTTEVENDYVIAEAVEISLNPFSLLKKRVELDIDIYGATGYLKQDENNSWLKLKLNKRKSTEGGWKFLVNEITLEDGLLNVKNNQPQSAEIKVAIPSGNISFRNSEEYLFNLQGKLANGGQIKGNGSYQTQEKKWLLTLNHQNLPIDTLNQVVNLPVTLDSGKVNGVFSFGFVNSKLALDSLNGDMSFRGVNLSIPKSPQTLSDSRGKISFNNSNIILKDVATKFGLIDAQAQGIIRNYSQLDIIANTKESVTIDNLLTSLKLDKVKLPRQGKVKGQVKVTGKIKNPVIKADVVNDGNIRIEKIPVKKLSTSLSIYNSQLSLDKVQITPTIGGEVTATGNVNLSRRDSRFTIDWQGKNIEAEKLVSLYQQKLPIQVGKINGEYQLKGDWQKTEQTKLTGLATVELTSGKAIISQLEINRKQWRGEVNLASFKLADLPSVDCSQIGCQESTLEGKFQISGNTQKITVENINLAGKFAFDVAQGEVALENTRLNAGNWQTQVKLNRLDVSQLPAVNLSSLPIQENIQLTANLQAQGNLNNFSDVNLQGQGKINLPQGEIAVSNFRLTEDNDFVATAVTNRFPLPEINPILRGNATGSLTLTGNLNNLQAKAIAIDGNLRLSQGISVVKQPLALNFNWNGDNIIIKQAATNEGIKAQGIVEYNLETNTVDNLNLDVSAKQVDIDSLPLPKSLAFLNHQGKFDFQGKIEGEVSSAQLQGKLGVNNLQLANLDFSPLEGNLVVSVSEGINFDLSSPHGKDKLSIKLNSDYQPEQIYVQNQETKVQGQAETESFSVNLENLPLDKVTKPWLSYLPESVKEINGNLSGNIDLSGSNYKISKANFTITDPKLNHLQGDQLSAELTATNGILTITKGNLQHLNNQYDFTGELEPFSKNPRLQANIAINQGNIQNLLTSLQFFEFGDIDDGFSPRKYATAKDLYVHTYNNAQANQEQKQEATNSDSLGVEKTPEIQSPLDNNSSPESEKQQPLASIEGEGETLLDSLAFFRTIEEKMEEKENNRAKESLPQLEELNGNFTGSINLTASVESGVKADFDFQGDYWQWGKYEGDLLQLTGSYNNGLLTFSPVKIQSQESVLSLTGTFQPETISGDIILSKFPLSQLKPFFNIPDNFDIEGDINATVAVSGSEEKPQAKGNIEIVDSRINGNEIEKIEASLGFRNSRIDLFADSSLNEEIDYFTIIASVPFQLFPNSIAPESDQFNVQFNLKPAGFSLLSVVTDNQLDWIEGEGNADLNIKGQYNQARNEVSNIQTEGIAQFNNGVINSNFLDKGAITNINGQVLFDFAQVNIPNLTGDFSGGKIIINGSLPLVKDDNKNKFLNIFVDDLALNLEELYQGNAHGNLNISGNAIAPKIGGKIELNNGDITLAKKENNQTKSINKNSNQLNQIKLNNLSLKLGNDVHIVQPVLLKVRAEGNLNLNGNLNNLSPEGVVQLKSGTVNLFTNQLKLVENRNNIARFTPGNGLNPYLDLQLESSVTETSRYQLPDNSNPNEIQDIADFSINTAQTIKVKANVKGWSDNLTNNIELSSSPSRSQTEIVALLGGGFVNNFAGGDSQLNLVNFASAAVLGSVQGEIHKALGIDELRLFPAQILDPEKRTSTLGLGAELALDLTDAFSVSITKILTNEQAPRYSLRYRLNEQTLIRGSSDFERDTRAVIEFQQRF